MAAGSGKSQAMTDNNLQHIAGQTDIGLLRHVNEDAFLIDQQTRLYAVADGMGGHGSGDVAANLALKTLHHCVTATNVQQALSNSDISDNQAKSLIYQCVADANQSIYTENVKSGLADGNGMGTTLVGLCRFGAANKAVLFNIGDSRVYRFQGGELKQLTTDHTMYKNWEAAGRIGPAPPRNIIMRAVGLFASVDIDVDVIPFDVNASYLLCSDGLTGLVDDRDIADALQVAENAIDTNRLLVKTANERGGSDNITIITLLPEQHS